MYYLDKKTYNKISRIVSIRPISYFNKKQLERFDCGIEEYNAFLLNEAQGLDDKNISKTFVLYAKNEKAIVGYFSLATDNIKLTSKEKGLNNLDDVIFRSFPAVKLGKLAINKNLPSSIDMNGYGSFVLDIIDYYVYKIIDIGVGCRFITVDADIEYDKNTDKFYLKNGFNYNENYKNSLGKTISMRRDVFHNEIIK